MKKSRVVWVALIAILLAGSSGAYPPKLTIIHFDVNVGDATLILSPDGHAVLVDAGNRGRGLNPIKEFLDRAQDEGNLVSLDYTVATHYDADHLGGFKALFENNWYPAIHAYDRGDTLMPPLDRDYIASRCPDLDIDEVEQLAGWGTAPSSYCRSRASKTLVEYIVAAEEGGLRMTIQPGDVITLDHGIEIQCVVVNATDLDGDQVDVDFQSRKDDCAANDLSIGLLLTYGDFDYLLCGDLTGVQSDRVADVEELLIDNVTDIDVYHVNHHGAAGCSSPDFVTALTPTVAVISNARAHNHPRDEVVTDRLLTLDPPPTVYCTNRPNDDPEAWQAPGDQIADLDNDDYDGIVELAVWRRTYRVFRWRDGERIGRGDRFYIKQ